MSIATVVTMGYGTGSFAGSVNLVPTLGYSIGVEVIADATDGVTFSCLNRFVTYKSDRIAEMPAIDRFNDYD